jgi:hypothetical protein
MPYEGVSGSQPPDNSSTEKYLEFLTDNYGVQGCYPSDMTLGASQSCKSRPETLLKALESRRFNNCAFVLIAKLGCTL